VGIPTNIMMNRKLNLIVQVQMQKSPSPAIYLKFELVSEYDTVGHRQINGSKCKKSKFSSELDQSESSSSDEEFRKFCRQRPTRRNDFESLGLKVRAYP